MCIIASFANMLKKKENHVFCHYQLHVSRYIFVQCNHKAYIEMPLSQ